MLEHVPPIRIHRAQVGLDVGEDRVLVEVVADQLRHERVDGLVVGDAITQRVGDRDVAGAVGVDQARHSDQRLLAPENGVEPLVVDTSIDHVNRAQTSGGPHEDVVVVDHQVAALDELHAHLFGEVQVLVVGGVVDARSQQDDRRVVDPGRREPAKVAQELVDVALHRPHRVAREQVRQDALHHVAVGQHV